MKIIYIWKQDYRSYSATPDAWEGNTLAVSVPDDFSGGNVSYNPETGFWDKDISVPPTAPELAESQRDQLLAEAKTKIVIWQIKLLAGRTLSAGDSAMLNAWLDYIDALETLEIDNAPNIDWPVMPS